MKVQDAEKYFAVSKVLTPLRYVGIFDLYFIQRLFKC